MEKSMTAQNMDSVIRKNRNIGKEIAVHALKMQANPSIPQIPFSPQSAFFILQKYGLLRVPAEDVVWSGAVYVRSGKVIPVINTAKPRAEQYFAAWQEVWYLLYSERTGDCLFGSNLADEDPRSSYFARYMMLSGVEDYFLELPDMDFLSKILCCMSAYQAPYREVLVALYECAVRNGNERLMIRIRDVFDREPRDLPERFRTLGLDDSAVRPSYVANVAALQERIRERRRKEPESEYHREKEEKLKRILGRLQ